MSITSASKIEGSVTLVLTEGEARALDAIVGYGSKVFVEWFYKTHGQHYLKPHAKSMESLFEKARTQLPAHLRKFDEARKALGLRHPDDYYTIKTSNQ